MTRSDWSIFLFGTAVGIVIGGLVEIVIFMC